MKMGGGDRRGKHVILFTVMVKLGSIDIAIWRSGREQSYITLVGLAHHIRRDSIRTIGLMMTNAEAGDRVLHAK